MVRTFCTNVSVPNAMVRIDLFECASRDEAHESLVRIVSDFESPLIEELKGPIGDVAFAGRGTGLILFARANLVYLLRNVGRRAVSVEPNALALDGATVAVPEELAPRVVSSADERVYRAVSSAEERAPGIVSSAEERVRAADNELIEVPVENAPTAGADDRRKYFSPAGELFVCDGCVTYRGPSSGLPEVKVCAG